MAKIKPLLAAKAPELDAIQYPVWASPKLDGIRAYTSELGLLSRSGKPIRNKHIQDTLAHLPPGLDGELIGVPEGDEWADIPTFQQCTSAIMRAKGKPQFRFLVFDCFLFPSEPYVSRIALADELLKDALDTDPETPAETIHSALIYDTGHLERCAKAHLEDGFEGTMIRKPSMGYKFGRSTPKSGHLWKIKLFESDEAKVTGFVEETHNPIAREIYALESQDSLTLAQAKRLVELKGSPQKDQLRGKGTLGALVVDYKGQELRIGTGFSAEQRYDIWTNSGTYCGQLAKFKYFPIGVKDLPRHPVFEGFRDPEDL